MPKHSSTRLLTAALIWDVPTLRQSKSEAAKAFLDALSATPRRSPAPDNDPLNLAAAAILAGRLGEDKDVRSATRALRRSARPVEDALALCLEWWFLGSKSSPAPLAVADQVVARLRGAPIRARVLAKLAAYSLDNHDREVFAALLQRAIAVAPRRSELRRALLITMSNELQVPPHADSFEPGADFGSDEITHYTWIDSVALDAARSDFSQRLTEIARNPWSYTFRAGQTPLDSVIAAELQATWSGALWKRRPIRKQLGAQLLLGGTRTPDSVMYGLARWIQGGGGDVPQIVEFAEPSFAPDTADSLIAEVLGPPASGHVDNRRVVELAANLWDLVSTEVLATLLPRISVDPTELGSPSRYLWSRAAVRLPRETRTALTNLTATQRVSLAGHLTTETLKALSRRDARNLLREIEADDSASERSSAAGIVVKAQLLGRPIDHDLPTSVALHVAARDAGALSKAVYLETERKLLHSLRKSVESAKKGMFGLGTYSTPIAIVSVAEARGAIEDSTARLLLRVARDKLAPGPIRVDCLVALARLAHVGLIPASSYRRLKSVPSQQTPAIFDPVPDSCLRAGVILLRAPILTKDEQFELITLSRDTDTRTRQFAASAAAIHLMTSASAQAENALLASLFDPHHSVVENALGVIAQHPLRLSSPRVRQAIAARLAALYDAGAKDLRRRCVAAAQALTTSKRNKELESLLSRAAHDRSWLVRLDAGSERTPARRRT